MNNKKNVCNNCIIRDYSKSFRTFRIVPIYNNRFAKKTENTLEYINNSKNNNILDTNRVNCGVCEYTTKQQKLTIRKKPTPWRMPYNHSRKSYICQKKFSCDVTKINVSYFSILNLWQEGPSAPGHGDNNSLKSTTTFSPTDNTTIFAYCTVHGFGMGSLYNPISIQNKETVNITVTVTNNYGGNKFVFNGDQNNTPIFTAGKVYIFDQSDTTNLGHPLRFSQTVNIKDSYNTTFTGTPGSAGATVTFSPTNNTTIFAYCTAHGFGMGSLYNAISVQNKETVNITVTVVNNSGNKFVFNGDQNNAPIFTAGKIYIFDQSDTTNLGHPLRFSQTDGVSTSYNSVFTGTPGITNNSGYYFLDLDGDLTPDNQINPNAYRGYNCDENENIMRFFDNAGFRVYFDLSDENNLSVNDILHITFSAKPEHFCGENPSFIRNTDINNFSINRVKIRENSFLHDENETESGLILQHITDYENNNQTFVIKVVKNLSGTIKLKINVKIEEILYNVYFNGNYNSLPTNKNPKTTFFFKISLIRDGEIISETRNNNVDLNPWKYVRLFKGLRLLDVNTVRDDELTPIPTVNDYPDYSINSINDNSCIYDEMEKKNICSNGKVIKETIDRCKCPGTVITTRFTDKNGIRINNSSNSYKSYLYSRTKLFEQNAQGLLPENKVDNPDNIKKLENTYYVGTVNGTVRNVNSGTIKTEENCELLITKQSGLRDISYQYRKMPVAVKKQNRKTTSSRGRLARLKYQTKIKANHINKSYNNCSPGDLCSKYISPGDNLKKTTQKIMCMSKFIKQKSSVCINKTPTLFPNNNYSKEELIELRDDIKNRYIATNIEQSKILKKLSERTNNNENYDDDNDDNDDDNDDVPDLPEIICNRDVTVML